MDDRERAHERPGGGFKILHAGNQVRCELHQQLQSSEGQHDRWLERDLPLRRGATHPVGTRRRLSLRQRSWPGDDPNWHVFTTQPRNDISVARGQWGLDNAYRYISEAYGGYHIDKMHGINVDAGIFLSYIGLWSFYNFDNWTYQPSFVSSNTPWFFNGLRIQIFPTDKLKIEPWLINGWQSYAKFNSRPGLGLQIL